MKKTVLGFAIAMFALQVNAADAGLGLSLRSNDARIYVPIDFGKIRIEPSVRYLDSDSSTTTEDDSIFLPATITRDTDERAYELGVGVFGVSSLMEDVGVYYGARVANIDSKTTQHLRTQIGNSVSDTQVEIDTDGFRLSPTLGFEYKFNKHFSLGGEAEWFYEDVDSDLTQDNGGANSGDGNATGTATRLILRFYF